jgi:hypothetical protein
VDERGDIVDRHMMDKLGTSRAKEIEKAQPSIAPNKPMTVSE